MNNPVDIFFPKSVLTNSEENKKQSNPIKKTVSAIKNVCTYINCLLMRDKELSSFSQLKYLGKIT
jgi:hypothetical protein